MPTSAPQETDRGRPEDSDSGRLRERDGDRDEPGDERADVAGERESKCRFRRSGVLVASHRRPYASSC
jgi:hypothetical protein